MARKFVRDNSGWQPAEDQILMEMTAQYGLKNWVLIANEMNLRYGIDRDAKRVRERWMNHLDPSLRKDEWTLPEEIAMFTHTIEMGHRWSKIAKLILGRNEHSVKNQYKRRMREFGAQFTGTPKEIEVQGLQHLQLLLQQSYIEEAASPGYTPQSLYRNLAAEEISPEIPLFSAEAGVLTPGSGNIFSPALAKYYMVSASPLSFLPPEIDCFGSFADGISFTLGTNPGASPYSHNY